MLTFVSMLMGADLSMAITPATPQTDVPQSQEASPDAKGHETDFTGTPATEASITGDEQFNDDEIDKIITKFRPFNYTLTTDIEILPHQRKVNDYKQGHAVMATPVMDCFLQKATTATSNITSRHMANLMHGTSSRTTCASTTLHPTTHTFGPSKTQNPLA